MYTAASHQGAIEIFWLHFWGADDDDDDEVHQCYMSESKLHSWYEMV